MDGLPQDDVVLDCIQGQELTSPGLSAIDPPVDGHTVGALQTDCGRAAWRLLLSAFVFESLLWGFPLSFGIFQNYYSTHPQFASKRYISVVGTVASGICYMGAPVSIIVLRHMMQYRRAMIWAGWMICILALLLSSFAHSLVIIILTQGVMYGIGFVIFYYPILSIVNEYWVARRGLAYGILCSASGVAGLLMPFGLEAMLNRFGAPITLRATSGLIAVATGPLLIGLKPRKTIVPSQLSVDTPRDWSFLRLPLFWIYSISNVLQGLGFFFPALYIPSYASALSLSPRTGALLLALMSVAQVIGQSCFGYLSDRKQSTSGSQLTILSLISTMVAGSTMLAWGTAKTVKVLIAVVMTYGFFGTGYTALWSRMGTTVTTNGDSAFMAFGLFNLGKGVGNVLAGPIGGRLLSSETDRVGYGLIEYRSVILFAGCCMLASATTLAFAWSRPFKPTATRE